MLERPGVVHVVVLTMIMLLSLSVMLLPVLATRGSYPGINGKIVFDMTYPESETVRQIFVMNPDGTDVKQLTKPPIEVDVNNAAWSPDGSKVAFTIDGNPGPTPGGIWVMSLYEPDWQHWIPIYAPSGWVTLDVVEPAWSPDGSKIAFTKQVGAGHTVSVMAAVRGATPTDLTSGRSPHWSPDGRRIVLERAGIIVVVDASTGTDLGLPLVTGADPCWSPDGSKIVYSSGAGIWVINAADGTVLKELTSNVADIMPNWSPDGTKIVFARFSPEGQREYGPSSIWVMNADGSNPTELTPWGRDIQTFGPRNPDWQPLSPSTVGGVVEPISKLGVTAPYFALFGVVGTVAVVLAAAPWKKPEN